MRNGSRAINGTSHSKNNLAETGSPLTQVEFDGAEERGVSPLDEMDLSISRGESRSDVLVSAGFHFTNCFFM
ncbi:MAG TPA: hypothetical protein VJI33_03695 [Candidatus Paceibacterota bacterium]